MPKQMNRLSVEERVLEGAIEKGEFVSTGKAQQLRETMLGSAKELIESRKTQSIHLRIPQIDLAGIKTKAESSGLPYQVLIKTLIRQYVKGKIELTV